MSETPRCDKLKSRLPIYNNHGSFKVITDAAEHWEKLARDLEREIEEHNAGCDSACKAHW
jgi:hypothetical protein